MSQKTIVMNAKNRAVTEYTNYCFNSLCKFMGNYLGADSTRGIMQLSGSDDDGTPIAAKAKTATVDIGKRSPKRVRDVWIVARKGLMTLKVFVDEGIVNEAATINADAAGTFIRTTGSFATDGFMADDQITGANFPSAGNNTIFEIASISTTTNPDDTITVKDNTGMVTESGDGDETLTAGEFIYNADVINARMHEERVKLGRGIDGRVYSFEIANVAGSDFDIDSIRILTENLRRAR